jgi:predicted MarR family transcription regulator
VKKAGTEPFVMLPRSLLQSDAWRAAGINTRRFIDFLLLEHMGHGGKANGKLKATDRQLQSFGIGTHYVTGAIKEAEKLGLVDCHRGGMRVATTYTVTWLPTHDGTAASNRWREQGPKVTIQTSSDT